MNIEEFDFEKKQLELLKHIIKNDFISNTSWEEVRELIEKIIDKNGGTYSEDTELKLIRISLASLKGKGMRIAILDKQDSQVDQCSLRALHDYFEQLGFNQSYL